MRDVAAGKEQYALKDLSQWLDDELAHTEPRQIDVFGIKFPAGAQFQWGIILILVVQVYFWLHLRELSPRLERDHPGLDVAWPGLYPSWAAHAVVWVSRRRRSLVRSLDSRTQSSSLQVPAGSLPAVQLDGHCVLVGRASCGLRHSLSPVMPDITTTRATCSGNPARRRIKTNRTRRCHNIQSGCGIADVSRRKATLNCGEASGAGHGSVNSRGSRILLLTSC